MTALQKVVCGVDGGGASAEAAHQAAALVAPGGVLELIAVAGESGTGLSAAAVLSKSGARRALDQIAHELRGCDARIDTRIVYGRPPHEVLMRESAASDLLVVARHSRSRLGGIAMGSTASNLAQRAHVPLLIASKPPHGGTFPDRILVAAGGPGHPERAVLMAGQISRTTGADITLVRLDWSPRPQRPELAAAVAQLRRVGAEPVEILTPGLPARKIPQLAAHERAALVVLGSRGLNGARSLSSISERVAQNAPCSVLIVRPPADDR